MLSARQMPVAPISRYAVTVTAGSEREATPRLRTELAAARAVALDLDGVLYDGDTPIPGAADAVSALRAIGVPVRFVTNTTSLSRRLIAEKLQRLGFDASVGELFCPARAAAAWLEQQRATACFFVPDAALEDFAGVPRDDDRPDAVVIGDLQQRWDFARLNDAFRLVHERGARLVALGRTRFWKGANGLQLDVGPFVAALEQATGTNALVFGKPEPDFFTALVHEMGEATGAVAMVGDDVISDVGAAMSVGLVGVLVRTGKFHPRDLDGPIRPDLVIDSVVDLFGR